MMGVEMIAFPQGSTPSITWTVPMGDVALFWEDQRGGSLATWISLNIDPVASAGQGLSVLTAPEQVLNTAGWRMEFLLQARRWYSGARKLKGNSSLALSPGGDIQIVDEIGTVAYIEWTAELLRFAEIIFSTEALIRINYPKTIPGASPPEFS